MEVLVERRDEAEEEADADAENFEGGEGLIEAEHVEEEGEGDAHVLHDTDGSRIGTLVYPGVQVLAQVVQDAQHGDQGPDLPGALSERNVERLLLRPDADTRHQSAHAGVVPLDHKDRDALQLSRRHQTQRIGKNCDASAHQTDLIVLYFDQIGALIGHLPEAYEQNAPKGTHHAPQLDKRDSLAQP